MPSETINPGTTFGLNQVATPQISPLGWFNQTDATPTNPIGGKIRWGNLVLRYVKIDVTVVPSAGAPLYALVFTPNGTSTAVPVITLGADYDGSGATTGLQVMAVMGPYTVSLPTTAFYTWVQVGGLATVIGTGVTAATNVLIGSTTDNQFAVISDGSNLTNIPAARVMGSCSGGLVQALLMNMDW